MWYNNYVGIPYQDKGRDRSGVDCWGLVRLVYAEQYGIKLPSFVDSYENNVAELIEEAVNANKESWHLASEPKTGDIVLFNILGHASHLGVYVGTGYFLHASEGARQAVIEKLSHPSWSRRLQGFYRYRESAEALITGHAHPLRREVFAQTVQAGTSAREIVALIQQQHEIYTETETECLLFVNGVRILEKDFDATIIKADDKIEYRSLVKGSRSILTLALLAATLAFGPGLGAAFQTAATGVTTTVGGSITVAGVTTATATVSAGWAAAGAIAINVAGTLLINQIAPIRQPKDTDPGQPQSADLFSGGSNPLQPYATIPVVLGTMRYTPPLGAQQVVEFEDVSKSRLNTLVVWGFGPLEIQDIQIGTKSLSEFTDNPKLITYSGKANENADVTDEIYKSDIKQATIGSPIVLQNLALGSLEADGETNPTVLRNLATVDITQEVDKLKIAIHFPEGLRTVIARGNDAGKSLPAQFDAIYSYQKLDANLNPVGSEISNSAVVGAYSWQIGPQFVQELYAGGEGPDYYDDTELYRWVGIFLLPDNSVTLSYGAPTLTANSTQMELSLAERIYASSYSSVLLASNISSVNRSITPPTPASGAIELYRFRVYGFQGLVANSTLDFTTGFVSKTGLGLTITGPSSRSTGRLLTVSLAAGTAVITPGLRGIIELGDDGQEYYKRKDAFTYVQELTVEKSRYRIKIQRAASNYTNSDLTGGLEPVINSDQEVAYKQYNKAFLYAVTGYSTDTKPINTTAFNSIGVSIAKTALSILSNKNLNGNLEGINGLVTSICRDYDTTTQSWDNLKATNNPASLFLHVLTHPANAYRIKPEDEAAQINFAELAVWWQYCLTNGFTYNNVITSTISVLDLLKDITAAGRASPTVIDGKWSVIIDKPRSIVTQYFTPNNSWGFEGSKALPTQPHAFRINFRNEAKAYQDDSIIVPNTGYTINTASVIEEISIPGITNSEAAKKHAQWHLAQIKLRPEVYTINTDIEYLVCTRGDLVRVSHDIPKWGTGTGRIKTVTVASGVIAGVELDNAIYLETTKTYKILVRTEANQTVERTIQAPATTDYYTIITFTQTLALNSIKPQELFIIGELGQETQELIVLGIEPQPNYTAKIVLTDYSPEIYTIDFNADYPQIVYNTNYTKPPPNLTEAIVVKPEITEIISGEVAAEVSASGNIVNNIKITYLNDVNLNPSITRVELEYDFTSTNINTQAQFRKTQLLEAGAVTVDNVLAGESYRFRLRYATDSGFFGPWSDWVSYTTLSTGSYKEIVQSLTVSRIRTSLRIIPAISETDLPKTFKHFKVKVFKDSGTGDFWTNTSSEIITVTTSALYIDINLLQFNSPRISAAGTKYRIACRMVDATGNESTISALTDITLTTISS